MQQPPLLPEEALIRVLRLARFDGTGVLVLSGTFAVMAALGRDVPFAVIGLLGAAAGAVELHGSGHCGRLTPRLSLSELELWRWCVSL